MSTNLTVKSIAALKAGDKPYSVSVSRGLRIKVGRTGVKNWIVQYVVKGGSGKQVDYWLSKPWGIETDDAHLSLADARAEAERIRAFARDGIDYQVKLENERKQQEEAEAKRLADANAEATQNLTVNNLFDAWIKTSKRKDGGAELRRSFNKDVLPYIGTKPLRDLVESDIVDVLERVIGRGAHRTGLMLRNNLQQMFLWGEGRRPWKQLIDNPVANLKPDARIFSGYDDSGRNRTLSASEIKELFEKLPASGLSEPIRLLILIMLACCTRIGETTRAQWADVHLESGVWKIPGANTKNGVDHVVFLSDFAIVYFKRLRDIVGDCVWCFPDSRGSKPLDSKNATKQIRDRQMSAMNRERLQHRAKSIDALVLAAGDWVPHDLRRTGATMMQSLGITPEVIERVLNHTEPDKLKRTYHRYDYTKEKSEAWRIWGERLELLVRQGSNVTVLEAK